MQNEITEEAGSERISNYGGFWIRLMASLIDSIILLLVNSILQLVLGAEGFYFAITTVVGIGYYTFLESSSRQATVGKMILDLKVVSAGYQRISVPNALGRYFAKMLSVIPMMIGLGLNFEEVAGMQPGDDLSGATAFVSMTMVSLVLMIIFYGMAAIHSKKQALHDRIAKTYVIREA